MVSSILQYLNIISLVNLFNILDMNKAKNKKTEVIKYNFKKQTGANGANESALDFNKELNLSLGLETEEQEIMDALDENNEIDFIESFEITNSNNLKTIGGFIIAYLDKVNEMHTTYDSLTDKRIAFEVTKFDQKKIEANLKGFQWLAKEGNESERQLVFIKMNKLKTLKYAGIASYLTDKHGESYTNNEYNNYEGMIEDVLNDSMGNLVDNEEIDQYEDDIERNNNNSGDGGDGDGEYENERQVNELGFDKYEMGEMGQTFDAEDGDDIDQDYDMLAADDYD